MLFPVVLAFQKVELVPNGTILLHIGLILLMIWILNRTFFRPINRIIESREKNKGGHSSEADEILKAVEGKRSQYDAALLEARSRGYELIEKERGEALAAKQSEIEAVKQEVARKIAQEKEELQRQNAEARTVIAQDAGQLAEKISSSILNVR